MNQLMGRLYNRIRTFRDKLSGHRELPPDLSQADTDILLKVRPFTMTSPDRVVALIDAIRHLSVNKIPGAIVECGVWRGGSSMAAMLTLLSMEDSGRDIYLYDTFEGMSQPTAADVSHDGVSAAAQLQVAPPGSGVWCNASLKDVKMNVLSTCYPESKIHYVRGDVMDTIPATAPDEIALLRLDTDWYESTKHELEHLFSRLHPKGILIIDDYGHWRGARKAVDEFFEDKRNQYYFHRIDYTGRLILRA